MKATEAQNKATGKCYFMIIHNMNEQDDVLRAGGWSEKDIKAFSEPLYDYAASLMHNAPIGPKRSLMARFWDVVRNGDLI